MRHEKPLNPIKEKEQAHLMERVRVEAKLEAYLFSKIAHWFFRPLKALLRFWYYGVGKQRATNAVCYAERAQALSSLVPEAQLDAAVLRGKEVEQMMRLQASTRALRPKYSEEKRERLRGAPSRKAVPKTKAEGIEVIPEQLASSEEENFVRALQFG